MKRPDDGGEYVSYQFYIEQELWDEWKNSVDRDMPLHDRLTDLLRADAQSEGGLAEVVEDEASLDEIETLNLLRLKLGRCNARAKVATEKIRADESQSAIITLDKIIDITQPFARET